MSATVKRPFWMLSERYVKMYNDALQSMDGSFIGHDMYFSIPSLCIQNGDGYDYYLPPETETRASFINRITRSIKLNKNLFLEEWIKQKVEYGMPH